MSYPIPYHISAGIYLICSLFHNIVFFSWSAQTTLLYHLFHWPFCTFESCFFLIKHFVKKNIFNVFNLFVYSKCFKRGCGCSHFYFLWDLSFLKCDDHPWILCQWFANFIWPLNPSNFFYILETPIYIWWNYKICLIRREFINTCTLFYLFLAFIEWSIITPKSFSSSTGSIQFASIL